MKEVGAKFGRWGRMLTVAASLACLTLFAGVAAVQAALKGEASAAAIYATHCAACHGPQMEGRAGPALIGPAMADMKAPELASEIKATMPLQAPGSLSEQDARALAEFIVANNKEPGATR